MPGCSVTASVSGPAGQAYGWSAYPCTGAVSSTTTATAADRKSTRLNSSHSQISYAVFCLKKKKISKEQRTSTPASVMEQILVRNLNKLYFNVCFLEQVSVKYPYVTTPSMSNS